MSRGADRGESDKGACRANGTMVTSPSVPILSRHENGRPCRVSCSKLPYVLCPYAAGVGAFSAFLELERDGNYAV